MSLNDGRGGGLDAGNTLLLDAPGLLLDELRLLLTNLHRHGTALDRLTVEHDLDRDETLQRRNK